MLFVLKHCNIPSASLVKTVLLDLDMYCLIVNSGFFLYLLQIDYICSSFVLDPHYSIIDLVK